MRKERAAFARGLRHRQTEAERYLWQCLRARQLMGLRFHRRYPLPPYVLDFYCAERALVIELDGSQPAGQAGHDAQRTDFLVAQGLTVLRYWNNDVMTNMASVLESLRLHIETAPHPDPLPASGEREKRGLDERGTEKWH